MLSNLRAWLASLPRPRSFVDHVDTLSLSSWYAWLPRNRWQKSNYSLNGVRNQTTPGKNKWNTHTKLTANGIPPTNVTKRVLVYLLGRWRKFEVMMLAIVTLHGGFWPFTLLHWLHQFYSLLAKIEVRIFVIIWQIFRYCHLEVFLLWLLKPENSVVHGKKSRSHSI